MTELILNLEKPIVEQAINYARLHNTSVNKLVNDYLKSLLISSSTDFSESDVDALSPTHTEQMAGMFAEFDDGQDYKTMLKQARMDKLL